MAYECLLHSQPLQEFFKACGGIAVGNGATRLGFGMLALSASDFQNAPLPYFRIIQRTFHDIFILDHDVEQAVTVHALQNLDDYSFWMQCMMKTSKLQTRSYCMGGTKFVRGSASA